MQEESVFYDKDGKQLVSINFVDKTPIKMFESNAEVLINAGENKNFYWIENVQPVQIENQIHDSFKNMKQGAVDVFVFLGARFSVIKVDENYFCKLLPESELEKILEPDYYWKSSKCKEYGLLNHIVGEAETPDAEELEESLKSLEAIVANQKKLLAELKGKKEPKKVIKKKKAATSSNDARKSDKN